MEHSAIVIKILLYKNSECDQEIPQSQTAGLFLSGSFTQVLLYFLNMTSVWLEKKLSSLPLVLIFQTCQHFEAAHPVNYIPCSQA